MNNSIAALGVLGCILLGSIALYRIVIRYLQKKDKCVSPLGKIVIFIIMLLISRLILKEVLEFYAFICRIMIAILGG